MRMERGVQTQVHLKVQGKDYKAVLTNVWMPGYLTYTYVKLYHCPVKLKLRRKKKIVKKKVRWRWNRDIYFTELFSLLSSAQRRTGTKMNNIQRVWDVLSTLLHQKLCTSRSTEPIAHGTVKITPVFHFGFLTIKKNTRACAI